MHGRPRKAPKPEDAEASAAKASKLRSLQSHMLHNHQNSIFSKEALDVSAKLLEINPEWQTAWNYRKLAVEHNLKQSDSEPESIEAIIDLELRVVESALRQNFKSYGAWHHRKWVLSKGLLPVDRELKLLDQLQKADSRNFHAWNYKRFVAALKNIPDEDELKVTTDMIETNFSNYSAWHNRSVLLSHLLKEKVQGFSPKEKVLAEEYELVHQALFTDPDDQSGWFYHLWLLNQTVKIESPLLLSSWPAYHSDLIIRGDTGLNGQNMSPFSSFCSSSETFPLILYFNQAVEGVNSSTVTVIYEFNSNEDLIWRPLSTLSSCTAQAWVTELSLPDQLLKAFTVEVIVGVSEDIVSLSGSHFGCPAQFAFTVCMQSASKNHVEAYHSRVISWRDEDFHFYEMQHLEPSLVVSLDQLRISQDHDTAGFKWRDETLANETALFRELLSEVNCKIGKLSLARLLVACNRMLSLSTNPYSCKTGLYEEALELFKELMQLDPSHSQYYKDEYSLALLRQITSGRESLLRHCCNHSCSTASLIHSFICLRLNNLSLSRIGSIDQLLWVQMLDLSHNELRSLEGLEAMQLLCCLNLRYNKICSFTALSPLKLLKSLEVLNVSHNEIGIHSIDTTRYLCSSPLSHTLESQWDFNEYEINGVELTNYWEAHLIFKGLNLIQLDIVGNAVADENFESFLVKLLPKLQWLNGQKLR